MDIRDEIDLLARRASSAVNAAAMCYWTHTGPWEQLRERLLRQMGHTDDAAGNLRRAVALVDAEITKAAKESE